MVMVMVMAVAVAMRLWFQYHARLRVRSCHARPIAGLTHAPLWFGRSLRAGLFAACTPGETMITPEADTGTVFEKGEARRLTFGADRWRGPPRHAPYEPMTTILAHAVPIGLEGERDRLTRRTDRRCASAAFGVLGCRHSGHLPRLGMQWEPTSGTIFSILVGRPAPRTCRHQNHSSHSTPLRVKNILFPTHKLGIASIDRPRTAVDRRAGS